MRNNMLCSGFGGLSLNCDFALLRIRITNSLIGIRNALTKFFPVGQQDNYSNVAYCLERITFRSQFRCTLKLYRTLQLACDQSRLNP